MVSPSRPALRPSLTCGSTYGMIYEPTHAPTPLLFISFVMEDKSPPDPSKSFLSKPTHATIVSKQRLFPTSVVGSLPRPRWLIDAIQRHERGELSEDELKESYDDAVKLAIREQELTGVDELSDGEQRRFSFLAFVAERLPSFRLIPVKELMNRDAEKFVDEMNLPIDIISNPVIVEKVRRSRPLAVDEVKFALKHTSKKVKAPIIGPYTLLINSWNKSKSGHVYRSPDEAFEDMAPLLRAARIKLRAAGASFVQLDDQGSAISATTSIRGGCSPSTAGRSPT